MRILGGILLLTAAATFAQSNGGHCVTMSEGAPSLPAHLMEGQGSVHFPITSSSEEARRFFEQGVAQMHSFWAIEAERSFLQAAKLDPEAPMPWWGVAMVASGDYRPHFQLVRDAGSAPAVPGPADKRALAAAERARMLAAVPGKATELEKLYIEAVAARRLTEPKLRDAAYIAGLRAIVAAHPEQVEARTYLALHLMDGYVLPAHAPRPGTMEAVAILRQLVKDAPEHPGVHHYVIHGWEGSAFAKDAWASCEKYSELATNIPHALHMPGHIYSQTGKLAEAATAFNAAAKLERSLMSADASYPNGHHGHNINYLSVVQAAAGQYDPAIASAREILAIPESDAERKQKDGYRIAGRQGWFALMRSMVWAQRWDDILNDALLPARPIAREVAWLAWARCLAYAEKGDVEHAKAEAHRMTEAIEKYEAEIGRKIPEELAVGAQELHARLTLLSGNASRAMQQYAQASLAERSLRYNEPPNYPRPVAEAWGEAALRAGLSAEAAEAFRLSLGQLPDSVRSVRGLAEAQSARPVSAALE